MHGVSPSRRWRFTCFLLLFGLLPNQGVTAPGDSPKPRAATIDFSRNIQPLLDRCIRCHGPKKAEGGLRLDSRARAVRGGDTGPAFVAGKASKSELLRRVMARGDHRMPPSGKSLTASEVARLRAWIDAGAHWPASDKTKGAGADHWAFKPIRRPVPPPIKNVNWPHNPIDTFVLARLEKERLAPSPAADRRTLLRRLSLDLLGLPPSLDEIEAFVNDNRPGAYERLVDRLLASPHFGERWGRHWLDLARFAESDGYENDNIRPNAWRYRDWVIASINRDQPFDHFTIEQLAGDLLPKATVEQKIATGLHRNTLWNSAASGDKEEFRTLAIKDRTDTTGLAWLGLTLGCARCHSHKYDPISQREYYQLYAFFNNTNNDDIAVPGGKAQALKATRRTTHVHKRGNFLTPGEAVFPGIPEFLPALKARAKIADRLDLARWLVRADNPLTARVTVNHLWQHLFGQGLVPAPENFGTSGSPPTHPELLDWLASRFAEGGWSRKALLRTIVLSATYRQASVHRKDLALRDPDNRLLARQNRVRVEAEIVRDLALASAGLLKSTLGGPSIVPPFPADFLTGQFSAESLKKPVGDRHRRSVYIHVQRTLTHPTLAAFDAADGNQTCVRRARSTTTVQALTLLNDPTFRECATVLGGRLVAASKDRDERLRLGFRLCLGRSPDKRELAVLIDLVKALEKLKTREAHVWVGVARTLLNLDGFLTRE